MILNEVEACQGAFERFLENAGKVCFFTGAGISTESGIPDFRSPGGIWSQYRIVDYSAFLASEEARLEDWRRRFHMVSLFETAMPNAAHRLIARMTAAGLASGVITQNIDGLHRRAADEAGAPDDTIVEFHGTGAHAHCLSCRRIFTMEEMRRYLEREGRSPRCADCAGLVKAAVVSFGESVPEGLLARASAMIESSDSLVAIGSSLRVWPAAGLLHEAISHGATLAIINREETPFDVNSALVLRASAAQIAGGIHFFS